LLYNEISQFRVTENLLNNIFFVTSGLPWGLVYWYGWLSLSCEVTLAHIGLQEVELGLWVRVCVWWCSVFKNPGLALANTLTHLFLTFKYTQVNSVSHSPILSLNLFYTPHFCSSYTYITLTPM